MSACGTAVLFIHLVKGIGYLEVGDFMVTLVV